MFCSRVERKRYFSSNESRSGRRPVIPVPAEYEKLGFVAGTRVRIHAGEDKLVLKKSG